MVKPKSKVHPVVAHQEFYREQRQAGSTSPIVHEDHAKEEKFASVMRSSFVAYHIPPVPLASSIRREKAMEVCRDRRALSPPFRASTNYDMSFANAVTPPPQKSMRPDPREQKHLPFTATSTNRVSFCSPSPADFPSRVYKDEQGTTKPLHFSATSEARKSFVNYNINKVPPRIKEEHRPLPKTTFQGQSTMHLDFAQVLVAANTAAPKR